MKTIRLTRLPKNVIAALLLSLLLILSLSCSLVSQRMTTETATAKPSGPQTGRWEGRTESGHWKIGFDYSPGQISNVTIQYYDTFNNPCSFQIKNIPLSASNSFDQDISYADMEAAAGVTGTINGKFTDDSTMAGKLTISMCGRTFYFYEENLPWTANLTNASEPGSTADAPANAVPKETNTPVFTQPSEPTTAKSNVPSVMLPDTLKQTFSGLSVIYQDNFDFIIAGKAPTGWKIRDESAPPSALRVTKENEFKIGMPNQDTGTGFVFYFQKEAIQPGEGVFFKFKYAGTNENFTFGFDNVRSNGGLYQFQSDGYRSFAMQMAGRDLSGHTIENDTQKDGVFTGNLTLKENTWYGVTLAMNPDGYNLIKIWDPNAPDNQLVYTVDWPYTNNSFYLVSWISTKRTLWVDDFTIFKFEDIAY
jgi:hypothetical protein